MEVRREGDGRFEVEGELDVSNAEQLGNALWAELRAGSSVVVDLSGLAFMDSQGLRLLLQLALHAEAAGFGPVVLVNLSPAVRRVLEISLPHGMLGLAVREERT
ncbi:MAG TPA: STAS domain-containing protein [Actinomycetota bacterium]